MYKKVTSAEKDFNDQVDSMTPSADTSQPLSPATPLVLNRLMNKEASVAGMEVMHKLNNRDFHSPELTCSEPNLPSAESNTESLIGHHSLE